MSSELFIGGILALLALAAILLVAISVTVYKDRKPRRKSRRRKKKSGSQIDWAKTGAALQRFALVAGRITAAVAGTLWKAIKAIAGAGWYLLSHLPKWVGRILRWVAAKLAILIGFLMVLGVYGIALALVLTALNIGTHYPGLIFVEFVKWGLIVIAALVALAASPPLFGVMRRLAN